MLASEGLFIETVEAVAALMSSDHAARPAGRRRQHTRPSRGRCDEWYAKLMHTADIRLAEVIAVLRAPAGAGFFDAPTQKRAFDMLMGLLPNHERLLFAAEQDLGEAIRGMTLKLEMLGQTMAANANHELGDVILTADCDGKFAKLSRALIRKAGGVLKLIDAAEALQITERAMQQQLLAGMALGVMSDREMLLPKLQFTKADDTGRLSVLPGIDRVIHAFETAKAGPWSALQFLLEPDPNLATTPTEALRAGRLDEVEHAARARLGMDEG
ncbi:hypothetical protein [Belnapia sp. F-4-1]|uniref:hypothetical protein n=1 Tax=Belnapia sp. F-4-1 TaxID=1545443 RepID=UPI0011867F1B|nr:hypothetical protein [Belnapia sp. F-4-1]